MLLSTSARSCWRSCRRSAAQKRLRIETSADERGDEGVGRRDLFAGSLRNFGLTEELRATAHDGRLGIDEREDLDGGRLAGRVGQRGRRGAAGEDREDGGQGQAEATPASAAAHDDLDPAL